MIQKDEIDMKAKEFEIHISNVERDYVFGWFLFGLFTISDLKHEIFLKGGNALRKGYFANTRFSLDIDLGIPNDIDKEFLISEINKICDFIQDKVGIFFLKDENKIEEKFTAEEVPIPDLRVYQARVYFKDFYGNSNHIRIKVSMDITRFDKTILPIQNVKLIHPYSDADEVNCEIRCMKLEEVIATKLKCLLQRQHAPDLFDYVYSVKLLWWEIDKEEIIKTFIQKTIFSKNPHVVKDILLKMPFDYHRKFWKKTIVCAKKIALQVDEAIDFFIHDLNNIFDIFPKTHFNDFSFFGADIRIPIMEAARSQTLLRIQYNDTIRLIEPYSLKYLQKKNGEQSEYFYVYDRTDSSTSKPGIKMFLSKNVQSIENTDEKFEPRAQIELSKAGEKPENPYLFDPNKPTRSPKRRPRANLGMRSSSPVYIYQCSFCGKKFHRKIMDSKMNQHKNKYWHICYGWYSVYVGTKY